MTERDIAPDRSEEHRLPDPGSDHRDETAETAPDPRRSARSEAAGAGETAHTTENGTVAQDGTVSETARTAEAGSAGHQPATSAGVNDAAAKQEPARSVVPAAAQAAPRPALGGQLPAVLLAVVAAGVYCLFNVLQWRLLRSPSWDLGIFTQLAKAYAEFSAPIVPIKGEGFNLLGDHFHPILVLLAPAYAIAPSGLTLLIVQSLLFALSAGVVAGTASTLLGQRRGLLIGGAYAVSWGLQSAISSQFHEIAFGVPLLAISLAAVLLRRWRWALISGGLLVFVKEDLGATVFMLGLVLAWYRGEPDRPRQWPAGIGARLKALIGSLHPSGLWLAAWGLGWMLLSVLVILPLLNPEGQFAYGGRLQLSEILANPLLGLGLLLSPSEKVFTLFMLLLTGALVWVRSVFALIAIPTILWRFWSALDFYWTTDWHYSAILMPVVFLALVDVLHRRDRKNRQDADAGRLAPARFSFTAASPAAAALVALAVFPQYALADLFQPETWAGPGQERVAGAQEVLETVPDGATVATDISLMAYLVPDHTVYWLGNEDNPAADYVVIDRAANIWGGTPPEAAPHAEQKFPGESYTLVLDSGGYQVARREG